MNWKSLRVLRGHVGPSDKKLPVSLIYECCPVVLVSVIFLGTGKAGWGADGLPVSVPNQERSIHVTENEHSVQAVGGAGWIFHTQGGEPGSATISPQRTSRSLVNTVMALLATLEEAGALPPEGTAQANQVIHALIQLQSAVVKTSDPELQRLVAEAIRVKLGDDWKETYRSIPHTGLTSTVVEALITYASQSAMWTQPGVVLAFRQFNVTEGDWLIVESIFLRARDVYAQQGLSIHAAFSAWLKKMS